MGNSVTVSILLDNGDNNSSNKMHRAGTNLTGRLVVHVRRKQSARKDVVLVVRGKEKTSVTVGKRTRYAARDFFTARLALDDIERGRTGTFAFPFAVQLPTSLPTSFASGTSTKNACSIQYKCVASVGRLATARQAFDVVSVPIVDRKVPCLVEPKTMDITSMGGVVSKGSITFGVGVDDTHIGKGQDLELSVACRNDTTVDIQHVRVKVVERTRWRVDANWEHTTKTTLVEIMELDLPGLVRRRKSKEQVRQDKRSDPSALRQSNMQLIHEQLSSGRNTIRIRIPSAAHDTYEGSLVSVSHYIKLYLKTPMLVADIQEKIPLRIGFPPQVQEATRIDVRPLPPPQERTENDNIPENVLPAAAPIPFATAVPLPVDTVEAPVATAPAEAIVLGGRAAVYDSALASSRDLGDLIPLPPPPPRAQVVPSLHALLEEMTSSVNDIDIISHKLQDRAWRQVISSLSPADFGTVIAHVNLDFDQPRLAVLLAPHVNGGDNCFTCVYCLSAVQNAAQWNRTAMVQKLLPLCVDVQTDFELLQRELSPWEQTVTAEDFQLALDRSNRL